MPRWCLLLVLLGLQALPAVASYTAYADSDSNATAQRLRGLEVVGTAAARNVRSSNPTYTLTANTMLRTGVTDIADALHRLPGINLRDYGGAGGLKTVSVRGLGANHTAVILDGLPVAETQSGTVDMARFTTDDMTQLSLAVGDGSDIFTSATAAASAATLEISTLNLPDTRSETTKLRARVKGGSFGTISPYAQLARSFGNGWGTCVSGEYRHADNDYPFTLVNGTMTSRHRRNHSMMDSWRTDGGLRFDGSDGSMFSAQIYYCHNDHQLPGAVVLYNPFSDERLAERNFFAQARWRSAACGKLRWQSAAKFSWDASRYRDKSPTYPSGLLDERYYQRQAYATASLLWCPDDKWSLDASADYSFSNLSTNKNQPQPHRHTLLAMAAASFRTSRLLASARLLASCYINGANGGRAAGNARRLSPSLNLTVQPLAERTLYLRASYKNIFRVPTFADAYFGTTGSPDLRPETTDQFNLGITWQAPAIPFVPAASFTADVYCNNVRDRIVAMPRNMFVWTMVNVGKVRAFGIDLTANVSIVPAAGHSLLLAGNYSFQRVQSRTNRADADYNKQVAYTPQHSGTASLSYENPLVNAVVSATAVSERYGTNSNIPASRIGGYADFSFGLYRTIYFGRYSIALRTDITNIFDRQYQVIARYPMPGRAWWVTATFNL